MRKLNNFIYLFIAVCIWMAGSAVQSYGQSTAWSLTITGQDQNGNQLSLEVGTSESATNGFDAGIDQYAPPAAPEGSFDFRIVEGSEDYFKFFRPLTSDEATWNLSVRPSSGGTEQVTLTWDNTSLTSLTDLFLIEYTSGTSTQTVDLTEATELVLPEGPQDLTIIHTVQGDLSISYPAEWQQIGYPAEGTNIDPFTVFSNGIAGTFFTYSQTYSEETEFTDGHGYWIRLSAAETVSYSPPFLTTITRNLQPGWYLISGPGEPVAFTDIDDPGSILVAGSLKGYSAGYVDADSLKPGRGYWVLSNGTGSITISSDGTTSATKQVMSNVNEPDGFASFSVSTNNTISPKFYIGGSIDEVNNFDPLSFSMPPLPPSGAFDVRFSDDTRLISGDNGTLLIQSPGDSLTLSHSNQTSDELRFTLMREGTDEENYNILPDESVTFSASGVNEIDVNVGVASSVDGVFERPERIELSQNYPNPFNPSTAISYKLPQAGDVTLEVFNMTGRRIAVLANEFQTAGSYNYDFDASNLSSGVYMYRLQTSGSTLTRKMTLIK